MYAYQNIILRPHEKQQQQSTSHYIYFKNNIRTSLLDVFCCKAIAMLTGRYA